MEKIKKDFNLIWILLIIGILLPPNAYAVSKDYLRVPIGNYDRMNIVLDTKNNAVELKRKLDDYLEKATMLLNSNPNLELLEGRIHDLLTDAQGIRMSLEALEKDVARTYIEQIRRLFSEMNKKREVFLTVRKKGITILSAQELHSAPIEEIRGYIYVITNGRYAFQEVLDNEDRVTLRVKAVDTGKPAVFVASPFDQDFKILERLHISKARHLNIAEVYEVDENNQYWIMEYIDGDDLLGALAKHNLSKEETVQVIDQLFDAIIWLENIGIYYKDVDKSNLIVVKGSQGEITLKLRDFGYEGISIVLDLKSLKQRIPSLGTWQRIERLIMPVFEAVDLKGAEKERIFLGLKNKYWTIANSAEASKDLGGIKGQRAEIRSNL